MKAAPYAVLGAAVVAGWISSPAVAFSSKASTDQAARPVSCTTSFIDEIARVRLAPSATTASHVHGSSCTCAACAAKSAAAD